MSDLDLSVLSDANCDDHPTDLRPEEIGEVIATRQWCSCEEEGGEPCGSYCYSAGAALYVLVAGGFATATESSDTTGHGCQCVGDAHRFATRAEAVRLGLTEMEARMLGLAKERSAAVREASHG